jgi:serine/threonine-protein kinase HipA
MSVPQLKYCPGSLAEGYDTYSPMVIKRLFNGKKVSHLLSFDSPDKSEATLELFLENRKRISISGVQEKLSFILDGAMLRPTRQGEQGTYILKPIPRDLMQVNQVPANEHLTMQMAKQVFGLETAENAMIFFANGQPAYITKRFDINPDGSKKGKEDFASLSGKSPENAGSDFKYTGSYEEAAGCIKKYVAAWRVDMERFFEIIIFNYLFSNGDAHLKNFSLLESQSGEYRLSPAYDLIDTLLHVNDTPFALDGGLFADNYVSSYYQRTHQRGWDDFREFGLRIGVVEKRVEKIIDNYATKHPQIEQFIKYSFLQEKAKRSYFQHYQTRRNKLIAK